jgi:RHS repeat-associated protein
MMVYPDRDATGTTRDNIDPSGKLLVRTHPNNTKTYYVYGLGLLYEANQANVTKTYHFDQVGSTLARTDDSGKVIGQAEYSAYGLTTYKQGDMATPFLYNGQAGVQSDPNGLLNMRARYYSPYLMRFLNADPSGFSGGPNWFAYADGNPISRFDPFGLCGVPSNYVSPYDSDGSVNWTGVGNYLYEAVAGIPDYIQQHGAASAKRNLSDPMFVVTSALGGMGMGGITGGLKGAANNVAIRQGYLNSLEAIPARSIQLRHCESRRCRLLICEMRQRSMPVLLWLAVAHCSTKQILFRPSKM